MRLEVHELTPRGIGAVSVLLVRGSGALDAVGRLCVRARPRVGAAVRVELADAAGPLDEALAVALDARRVELHLHGSRPIVRRVREALGAADVGATGPPGFEGDAAELEARAWRALAAAPCEAAARVLLDQAQGALRRELEAWLAASDGALVDGVRRLGRLGFALRPLFEPVRVVLAGPVNAGKSTLFNALVGSERAIVSSQPGTTRDRVRAAARLGPYAVELVDTAGERDVGGVEGAAGLEARGQELARGERGSAELVVWLEPADASPPSPAPESPGERRVVARSRVDLAPRPGTGGFAAGPDPEGARRHMEALFRGALELPAEPWIPGRAVPFDAELRAALDPRSRPNAPELRAVIRGLLGVPRPG